MSSTDEDANKADDDPPPPQKYHTITVCMVPPPSETKIWEQVTKARTDLKDPGLFRWPPHANLLYPFVSIKPKKGATDECSTVDEEILHRLRAATQQCEPFQVNLDKLGTFGGAQRGVLWLYPKSSCCQGDESAVVEQEPLVRLQSLLEKQFPTCTDQRKQGRFHPHMTISHFASLQAAQEAQEQVGSWWPHNNGMSFLVNEIYLLQRNGDDGQFLRVATIPLGENIQGRNVQVHNPPEAFPLMPSVEEDWVREERMKMKERRNHSWKRSRRRRGRGGVRSSSSSEGRGPSRSRDSPEVIAAKRAERKAKRERLERENRAGL